MRKYWKIQYHGSHKMSAMTEIFQASNDLIMIKLHVH